MTRLWPFVALAAACAAQAQSNLTVEWEWKREHRCSATSPALQLRDVPAGTRLVRVKLVDNDATGFHHGGGEVQVAAGDSITLPAGALKSYTGPCPPNFGSFGHDYTFNITALAEDGKTVLATGAATKNFSAKSVPQ